MPDTFLSDFSSNICYVVTYQNLLVFFFPNIFHFIDSERKMHVTISKSAYPPIIPDGNTGTAHLVRGYDEFLFP